MIIVAVTQKFYLNVAFSPSEFWIPPLTQTKQGIQYNSIIQSIQRSLWEVGVNLKICHIKSVLPSPPSYTYSLPLFWLLFFMDSDFMQEGKHNWRPAEGITLGSGISPQAVICINTRRSLAGLSLNVFSEVSCLLSSASSCSCSYQSLMIHIQMTNKQDSSLYLLLVFHAVSLLFKLTF